MCTQKIPFFQFDGSIQIWRWRKKIILNQSHWWKHEKLQICPLSVCDVMWCNEALIIHFNFFYYPYLAKWPKKSPTKHPQNLFCLFASVEKLLSWCMHSVLFGLYWWRHYIFLCFYGYLYNISCIFCMKLCHWHDMCLYLVINHLFELEIGSKKFNFTKFYQVVVTVNMFN